MSSYSVTALVVVVTSVLFVFNLPVSTADKLCYACNSYMSQCQHPSLHAGTTNVFQARCTGKCFTRQGEDDAIYRGCFDAFKAVKQLTENYIGCRNQTWNNRVRRWCLCDTDLCNIHAIDDTVKYAQHHHAASSHSQTSSSTVSQGTSLYSGGSSTAHFITPQQPQQYQPPQHYQQPVQQQQQPQPPQQQQQQQQAHHHYYDVVQALKQPVSHSDTVSNNTPAYPSAAGKNAEFNSVWNSWHVDLSNVNRPAAASPLPPSVSLPAPQPQPTVSAAVTGPVESYSGGGGVLHSIHNHQQPTKSYAGTEVFRIRQHPVRVSASPLPQSAKSNDFPSEIHEGVEPIENHDSDSDNFTLSSSTEAAASTDKDTRSERYQRMLQNADSSSQSAPADAELSELIDDNNNNTASINEEDLEYPYNQNVHHSVEWSPVDYSDQPAVTRESGSLTTETSTAGSPIDAVEGIEYPYNQERQPFNDIADSNNYADYGAAAVLKEAPEHGEETEDSEQPEVLEKALDYPYNQLLVPDLFGNPTSVVHDKKKGSAAVSDETIHDTVHSPHHQSIIEDNHQQQQQQQQQKTPLETRTSRPHHQVVHRQEPSQHQERTQPDAAGSSGGVQEIYHRPAQPAIEQKAPVSAGEEMAPLKMKDKHSAPTVDAALTSQYHHHQQRSSASSSRQGIEPRLEAKEGDDGLYYENMGNLNIHSNQQIVPQIRCSHTGYYQNPKDCTQFVACLFDHNTRTKVLHLMRCPSGLVWDNFHKLCMETSSTCREGLSQANLDNNYFQFFADVNGAGSTTTTGSGNNNDNNTNNTEQQQQVTEPDTGLLKDIKHKLGDVKQF